MTFGGSEKIGGVSEAEAGRQIDLCIDHGVNLIDTADIYSDGASEEIIGSLVRQGGRKQKLLISTKLGIRAGSGPNDIGTSRHRIIAQAEQSLRRLGVETLDLYQLHAWDGLTPAEEIMESLDLLVRSGKVRYVGCSNFSGWHVGKMLRVSDLMRTVPLISQQIHYTLYSREAEQELIPIGLDSGLAVIVWSPLAGGLLTGKYSRIGKPTSGRHVSGFPEPPIHDWERLYAIVDELKSIASESGHAPAQLALAWLIHRPGVTSAIVGGRTLEQFGSNLGAATLVLDPAHRDRLDAVSALPLPYPYWHQVRSVSERFGRADLLQT